MIAVGTGVDVLMTSTVGVGDGVGEGDGVGVATLPMGPKTAVVIEKSRCHGREREGPRCDQQIAFGCKNLDIEQFSERCARTYANDIDRRTCSLAGIIVFHALIYSRNIKCGIFYAR